MQTQGIFYLLFLLFLFTFASTNRTYTHIGKTTSTVTYFISSTVITVIILITCYKKLISKWKSK